MAWMNRQKYMLSLQVVIALFANALIPVGSVDKSQNVPSIMVEGPEMAQLSKEYPVKVTYQNDTSYSGNEGLEVQFLLNDEWYGDYELPRVKPNQIVNFTYNIKFNTEGKHAVQAKVVRETPNSDKKTLVAKSNVLTVKIGFVDSDHDILTDDWETNIGTDPKKADTDSDGLPDGYEYLECNTNPLNKDTDEDSVEDGQEDFDADGLTNLKEFELKTNPFQSDTDNDGYADKEEIDTSLTNPVDPDTDRDYIVDGHETQVGFDPLNKDTDGDGILDGKEIITQSVSEERLKHLAVEENLAIPHILVHGAGDINRSIVVMNEADNPVLRDIPGIVGYPIDIHLDNEFDWMKVSFTIKDEALQHTKLEYLTIARYDLENNTLVPLKTEIDHETNTLTTEVNQCSLYFVIDISKQTNSCPAE